MQTHKHFSDHIFDSDKRIGTCSNQSGSSEGA